jgi:hypothetical protein
MRAGFSTARFSVLKPSRRSRPFPGPILIDGQTL